MPNDPEPIHSPLLAPKQTERSRLMTKPSPSYEEAEEQLLTALSDMTMMRSAQPDSRYLALFARRLSKVPDLERTLQGIEKLAIRPVREGEPRLPDYGTILEARPLRDSLTDWEIEQRFAMQKVWGEYR